MTQAWNLSQLANKINTSGQLDAATGLSGQLNASTGLSGTTPVANGGTGVATITANGVLIGNGTSAVTTVAPSTSGNVLTSNGTTWVSAAGGGYAGFSTVAFGTSTTWAVPSGITRARITVIGAGGAGRSLLTASCGGFGGIAVAYCTGISGTLTITVGSTAGATSSVSGTGVLMTATGGAAGTSGTNGANGAGSISTGTALKTGTVGKFYNVAGTVFATNTQGNFTSGLNVDTTGSAWSSSTNFQAGNGGIQNASLWMGGAVIIEY